MQPNLTQKDREPRFGIVRFAAALPVQQASFKVESKGRASMVTKSKKTTRHWQSKTRKLSSEKNGMSKAVC